MLYKVLLCALYLIITYPASYAYGTQECYYAEPLEQKVDGDFFQKLICQGYNKNETILSIEKHLRDNIPLSHRFHFKFPLKDKLHAQIFAKVMKIKAQEAHRFVPVIELSKFISPCHLGFIREILIKNGPRVQEHVLIDNESEQIIFIEDWVIDTNNLLHPGSFAAINSVIETDGKWFFAGTYFYNKKQSNEDISQKISMFQQTYANMIAFIENEDVDYFYSQLQRY